MPLIPDVVDFRFKSMNTLHGTVKPLITNTSEEFIKCRLDNFSVFAKKKKL